MDKYKLCAAALSAALLVALPGCTLGTPTPTPTPTPTVAPSKKPVSTQMQSVPMRQARNWTRVGNFDSEMAMTS